jgi:hypothetical protein
MKMTQTTKTKEKETNLFFVILPEDLITQEALTRRKPL